MEFDTGLQRGTRQRGRGDRRRVPCDSLAQGKPGVHRRAAVAALLGVGMGAARAACEGPRVPLEPLAPALWRVPAAPGDAGADNRGRVSNLLLAQDGDRLWLLGSGPSPAFGRALDCTLRARFGRAASDIVSPWPRPELVLGVGGLSPARHWAHAAVAEAMRSGCPGCTQRLRQRLGAAAEDLGTDPVRLPTQRLEGRSGTLGPWQWRLDRRGAAYPVTVWTHRPSGIHLASGLLWGDGAPDGRDADLDRLAAATAALAQQAGREGGRWLGEQGPLLDAGAPALQARYWQWLLQAARRGVEAGDDELRPPEPPAELHALAASPRHALNWQRAWRQAESGWLQRSLR